MSSLKKVFFCIILPLGILVFLIGTTTGLNLVLNGVTSCVPGLKMSSASGSWHNLTVKQLKYTMSGMTIIADEVHLKTDFGHLNHFLLCIDNITLKDVRVKIRTTELKSKIQDKRQNRGDNIIPAIFSPLILHHAALNNVQIEVDNIAVSLDNLNVHFTFQNNTLTAVQTYISGLLMQLSTKISPEVLKQKDVSKNKFNTQIVKKKWIDIEASKRIICACPFFSKTTLNKLFLQPLLSRFPSLKLPLNWTLLNLKGDDLYLIDNVNLSVTNLYMKVLIRDQHVETNLSIESPQGFLNAFGNVELNDQCQINLTVNTILNIDPLKGEKIELLLHGNLYDGLRTNLNFSGPLNAQIDIKLYSTQTDSPLSLALDNQMLQCPLIGTPQYQLKSIAIRPNNKKSWNYYRLMVKAKFNVKNMPKTYIQLEAKNSAKGCTLLQLQLTGLQGCTRLSAVVDQKYAIWRIQLFFDSTNTMINQWPNWPIWLNGKINIHGTLHDDNWKLKMLTLNLRGIIQKNTLIARGSIIENDCGQWKIPRLLLVLGRNQLAVQGELKQKFTLDAIFNALALNDIFPELAGQVQGNINLRGDIRTPKLLIDLKAYKIRWKELDIQHVAIQGNMILNDIIQGDIQLRIDKLQQRTLSINRFVLTVTGNEHQHQFKLEMQSIPVSGRLQINAAFDRQKRLWKGILRQTCFNTPIGEWQLIHAVPLNYQIEGKKFFIDSHCLKNLNAQICTLKNSEVSMSDRLSLQLYCSNLKILKSLFAKDIQIAGILTGKIDIYWTKDSKLPQGKISLVSSEGMKITQTVQDKTLQMSFERLILNIMLDKKLACLNWFIKTAGNGQFNGQIQITDPLKKRNFSGNMKISNFPIALFDPLVSLSHRDSIDGFINAALSLGGNGQQPRLHGQLTLDHLVIKNDYLPLNITNSQLDIIFLGSNCTLQGLINTLHGQLILTGSASWNYITSWYIRINAKGDQVRIGIPQTVRLIMSPDVVLKGTSEQFSINGKIDIPWARLEVKDLSKSIVHLSSDEVLLDDDLQSVSDNTKNNAISINSNFLVHFGDDVYIDAFGLQAKLKGSLKVKKEKQQLELNGQVTIPSGRFYAYGQNLIINKGQMFFSGPIDQPYLNIEAIRNPNITADNVIAGVRVTGLADKPKVKVFSNPFKSQQEALSYLLRGQGLDAGSDNKMTAMLISMGIAQSRKVISKIGQAFGVNDLSLGTQGDGDNSKVVVSGYIAPDLQVKYGVGIFDSLATLTLRYRLMSRFYLEIVSGLEQTLDFLYQFDF